MVKESKYKIRRIKLSPAAVLTTAITLLVAALWVAPILYIFNPWTILVAFFESFGDTLKTVQSPEFLESLEFRWYLNSMGVSMIVTLLTILLSVPCAYAVSRLDFPGKTVLFWLLIAGMIVPKEVLSVPLFIDLAKVRLANTYFGITLPQVVAPMIILAFKYYFDRVPTELREAAYMDGANEWRILWSVYVPFSRMIVIVLSIFTFIIAWNNFFWPFIITYSEELMTLPVALGTQGFGIFGFTGLAFTVIFFLLLGLIFQLLLVRTGVIQVGVDNRASVQGRPLLILVGSIAAFVALAYGSFRVNEYYALRQPLPTPLKTLWADKVTPENVHQEYPRPQLARETWLNLNGEWDYAFTGQRGNTPKTYTGKILVPFPVESALSGVALRADKRKLWYHRTFTVPEPWQGQRIILHFGAVDYEAKVWVNNQELGMHQGGYDSFSFDITDALTAEGEQKIVVSVIDPSDSGTQPRGKQVRNPEGIWYTSTTGIWQTVWLEPVAETYIANLKMETDIDSKELHLNIEGEKGRGGEREILVKAVVLADGEAVTEMTGNLDETLSIKIPNAKLWSPDEPFLYDLKVTLLQDDKIIDEVSSYFGMRKISVQPDETGVMRLFLNNKVLFQFGLLDQGFWPDGLYTAPTDDALRYDIEVTKKLGFNMIRKHVKVESARWYYWADKLGVLVWQDIPSGDAYVGDGEGEIKRTEASAKQFELELQEMIDEKYNHPSVVMWVLFNEGWGQYDTVRLTEWLKNYDETRLVNSVSGWNDMGVGDVRDIHSYPGPNAPQLYPDRASVLGEFGGLGLTIAGLTWQAEANWGYQEYGDATVMLEAYNKLIRRLRYLSVEEGLAAAVYTQTTDVEIEVNGMMTYDRKLVKMEPIQVRWANRIVYRDPPIIKTFVPHSLKQPVNWKYTFEQPASNWTLPGFDDSNWQEGPAGFGAENSMGGAVRTEWNSDGIWMRHTFDLSSTYMLYPYLRAHHNEEMEVYLNGQLIKILPNYTFEYVQVPLEATIRDYLKEGKNTLSIHCKKVSFGQYCDAGLYDTNERLDGSR